MRNTKQQQIDTLRTENEQLRTQLAQSFGENKVLSSKLFALNNERAKWEHRARDYQRRLVGMTAPTTNENWNEVAKRYFLAFPGERSVTREQLRDFAHVH